MVNGVATAMSAGPANESAQALNFLVANTNNALFSAQPAVDANGVLTYTPAANAYGSATVTLRIHDDGGLVDGGVDTSGPRTFVITVTPVADAPLMTVVGGSFVYDGTAHAATATVAGVDGKTIPGVFAFSYSPGGSEAPVNAGTYDVVATFTSSDSNYTNSSGTGTVTITPATATVTAGSGTKVYGTSDPALTATATGFTAADAATITLERRRARRVTASATTRPRRPRPVRPSRITTISYVPGTFSITTATATVTAGSGTKVYGTSRPGVDGDGEGFTAADALTIALSATRAAGDSVGDYATTATATGAALVNYSVSYVPARSASRRRRRR